MIHVHAMPTDDAHVRSIVGRIEKIKPGGSLQLLQVEMWAVYRVLTGQAESPFKGSDNDKADD